MGPDAHLTTEQRVKLLEPTVVERCTGLDHFDEGPAPLVFGALLIALAIASLRTKKKRAHWLMAAASLLGAFLVFYGLFGIAFRHLLENVGEPMRAQRIFDWSSSVVFWSLVALAVFHAAIAFRMPKARPAGA